MIIYPHSKAHLWEKTDLILSACATLIGCKPDVGMANTWNEIERADGFVGCCTIGEFLRVWLAFLATEVARRDLHQEDAR